jgi:hypothetical protein
MNYKELSERSDRIRKERLDKMFNVENYPEHLRLIVKVILDDGEMLTDGIQYYATYDGILKFANDIYLITGANS